MVGGALRQLDVPQLVTPQLVVRHRVRVAPCPHPSSPLSAHAAATTHLVYWLAALLACVGVALPLKCPILSLPAPPLIWFWHHQTCDTC
jgi:hypothetical protein